MAIVSQKLRGSLNLHPNTVSKIVSTLKKQRFFLVKVD